MKTTKLGRAMNTFTGRKLNEVSNAERSMKQVSALSAVRESWRLHYLDGQQVTLDAAIEAQNAAARLSLDPFVINTMRIVGWQFAMKLISGAEIVTAV